jgi:hypothetical protein
MTYYRRASPSGRERLQVDLVSLGVAAGVAALSFYFARLLLSREALDPHPSGAAREPLGDARSKSRLPQHSPSGS